ncbi:hypothetical protein CVIRNUC_005954 [Coccomyxa viridis]|uniref:Bulb-type lectin domain-containing protein n=1 Tax=Coccomyxa viridis TaxID=1274662 RepID=A0AAV1I5U7_9CHLO|nr:hypothetical protein CVIRNUC_005954 [Coccomyxa viridis]
MSASPQKLEGWEQINGAELYKGQQQFIHRNRCCAQDGYHGDCASGDYATKYQASAPAAATSRRVYPQIPCSASQPVADPSVPQGWETVDETDCQQATVPELPGASKALPKPMTSRAQDSEGRSGSCEPKQDVHMLPHAMAPPLHSGEGELPAIQMQGLDSLVKQPRTPQQSQPKPMVAQQQAAAVPAESPPLPLSSSPAPRAPEVLRRLTAGDKMIAGDRLESSNGLSSAVLQGDGNFVVYTRENLLSKVTNVAWSTGTYQGNRKRSLMGHELFAQDDGNLVLYTRDCRVAWASNTDSPSKDAYTLEVTDSGTLVWYCETTGEEVWTSR